MANETVTESTTGTTTEAEGINTPEAEVETPETASKVSSKEKKVEIPTITQTQHEALLHMATSESGRLQKVAETERDELKTKTEKADELLEDIQEERDRLQAANEELTSDDPKKFDIVTRDKELRAAQKLLKTATDELATKNQESDERIKLADSTLLEIAIWEVATEYKGSDPVRLKNLCASLGVTTEAKLREVAGNLWEKAEAKAPEKKAEGEGEPKEKLNLHHGDNHGGGNRTEQDRLDERYPTMVKK